MASFSTALVWRRGGLAAAGTIALALAAVAVFLGDRSSSSASDAPPTGPMLPTAAAPASTAPGPAATAPVTQITESGFLRARGGQFRTIADPQAEGVVTMNGLAYSGTAASGINDRGQIVGSYAADGTAHGFLLDDGVYRTIDVPSARSTSVADINNRGELVGSYTGRDGQGHGFERSRSGRITTIDVPGAFSTDPHRINDRGQLVGVYSDVDNSTAAVRTGHGFLWDHGHLTRFDAPGGGPLTDPAGLNDRDAIVGAYDDPSGVTHGFLRNLHGQILTIDLPGAAFTSLVSINGRGDIVGQTATADELANQKAHGVLLHRGATDAITLIDVPGFPITAASDIDDRGQIVGFAYRIG